MSVRLTTAVKIGETAKAVLRRAQSLPEVSYGDGGDLTYFRGMGVEPMLFAFAMELALKAWIVFDHDSTDLAGGHNLIKLFEKLAPASQEVLENEFKRSVAPFHPSGFFVDFSIRHVLYQHKDAFVKWRYIYEDNGSMSFDRSVFEAALEMVLAEFEKRYYTVSQVSKV
jgi:hypothetical protein